VATILYVTGESLVGALLEDALARIGHRAVAAPGVPEALRELGRGGADLIIADVRAPGVVEGTGLVAALRREGSDLPVILLADADARDPGEVGDIAAVEVLPLPVRRAPLGRAVARALELVRLRRENAMLRGELTTLRGGWLAAEGVTPRPLPTSPGEPVVLSTLNVDEAERALIARALAVTGNNRTRAAVLLGISVRTLRNKLNGRTPGPGRRQLPV
jgi:DNA-binding NtrC family response regulator